MGNSNSSSATSALSTSRTFKTTANGSVNGSMKRRGLTKPTRLSSRPPPPKNPIKHTLSTQQSLNAKTPNTINGNISPTDYDSTGKDSNFNNIRSSRSMYELYNKQSPSTPNAPFIARNESFKHASANNSTTASLIINDLPDGIENDAALHLMSSRFAQPPLVTPSTIGRSRSVRRFDPSHPILPAAREICRSCFENPHNDFGNRVLSRVYEKRPDFQKFVQGVGKDKWHLLTNNFQNFIEEIVNNIESVDAIQRFSQKYGEEHVSLKSYGFKPDFWVTIADAILVEGAILDMANHQPTEVVTSWASLAAMMFSSVRDGYYSGLRMHRMSTRKKSLRRQESVSTVDSSDNLYSKTFGATTPDLMLESNGNSMNSSFTDSMHRLLPSSTTRFSLYKSDSQSSCKLNQSICE